jgi:hypothetical protein
LPATTATSATSWIDCGSVRPFAATLVEKLQNFQVKVTEAANETFGALGEGYHDDLVLADHDCGVGGRARADGGVGVYMKSHRRVNSLRHRRPFW